MLDKQLLVMSGLWYKKMFNQRYMAQARPLLVLIIGVLVGFSLSQLLRYSDCNVPSAFPSGFYGETGSQNNDVALQMPLMHTTTTDNGSLAKWLYNETRVLCLVMTGPSNHFKRAIHIKRTWGKRCNKLLLMSSQQDLALGTVKLNVSDGRSALWQKTREAFKYVYEHHLNDADWFLKSDDDTYVIMENLRAFLYPFDTNAPVYFGCKFKEHVAKGYMSGGAGYVLSKEAVRRFVQQAYPNATICRQRAGGAEDMEMGKCLQNVNVVAGDSRDEQKRGRFFPASPERHLIPFEKSSWYWKYIYYATTDGLNCCSDFVVSFHYISMASMYTFEYLLYQVRLFGLTHNADELPAKRNMTELLHKWREEKSDNPL